MQRKKKIVLIVLAVAVALFIMGSITRCAAKATNPSAEATQSEPEDPDQSPGGEQGSPAQETGIGSRNYSQKEQEFLDYLAASKWADPTGKITAEFTRESITEHPAGGSERSTPFQLESLEAKPNETTAVVETEGKHVALSLVLPLEGDATVSSQAFALSTEYQRISNVRCVIEGLDGEAASLVEGEREALEDALAEYCEWSLPTATSIAFTGSATIDTKANTVTLFFEPNTVKGVSVQAIYNRDSHSFNCSMASGVLQ